MEGTPVQPVAIMGGTFPYRDNGRPQGGIRVFDYSENGDNRGQNLEEDAGTHRPPREPPEHPKVHERT